MDNQDITVAKQPLERIVPPIVLAHALRAIILVHILIPSHTGWNYVIICQRNMVDGVGQFHAVELDRLRKSLKLLLEKRNHNLRLEILISRNENFHTSVSFPVYSTVQPPSTGRIWPVIKSDAEEQRN